LVKTLLLLITGATAAVACAIALSAGAPPPREIQIVARNMTFYVDGRAEANPALRVRRGENLRIVFRNEDAGMKHDFVIPDWDVEMKTLAGKGETSITFRVPDRAAPGTYICTPHSAMMRGTIAIE
jgi:plastocyanin